MLAAQKSLRPAPWLPVVTCEIAAATLFAAERAGGLHGTMLLVTPLALAFLGCFIAVDRWTDRYKLRASADAWIARGYDSVRSRYGWRVEELTSRRERRALARSLRSLLNDVAHPVRSSRVPIDVVALRPCLPFFEQLTERVEDVSRPVSACGMLGVERLLTDGATSPLYGGSGDLRLHLIDLLDRLEVRR